MSLACGSLAMDGQPAQAAPVAPGHTIAPSRDRAASSRSRWFAANHNCSGESGTLAAKGEEA